MTKILWIIGSIWIGGNLLIFLLMAFLPYFKRENDKINEEFFESLGDAHDREMENRIAQSLEEER